MIFKEKEQTNNISITFNKNKRYFQNENVY